MALNGLSWISRSDYNQGSTVCHADSRGPRLTIQQMNHFKSTAFKALLLSAFVLTVCVSVPAQHDFTFEEYEKFHDVLHPLEHEAVPQKDYARIRARSSELVQLGNAIVKLGVPEGSNVPDEMRRELKTFKKSLRRFSSVAKGNKDRDLETAFEAVHDSFEKLAALSRDLAVGCALPPPIAVQCPEKAVASGDTVVVTAIYPPDNLLITWTLTGGRIVGRGDQPTITIDTSKVNDPAITVTAEINDGNNLLASGSCVVKLAPRP